MKIRFAELNIELCNRYPHTERMCRDFAADFDVADLTAAVTTEEIEADRLAADIPVSAGYAEFICLYRKLAQQLPDFGAFVFHAAVVVCDGFAYAFAAPSGTGKSTHVALWQKRFGERAYILNGDKPVFRLTDDGFAACGTPWCGKERQGVNGIAPLRAICFLERGEKNEIAPLSCEEAALRVFSQVLIPTERATADRFLSLLDRLVTSVPTYLLHCNMDEEAAAVAFAGMNRGE